MAALYHSFPSQAFQLDTVGVQILVGGLYKVGVLNGSTTTIQESYDYGNTWTTYGVDGTDMSITGNKNFTANFAVGSFVRYNGGGIGISVTLIKVNDGK